MTINQKLEGTSLLVSAWGFLKTTAPNLGAGEQPNTETTAIHILSRAIIAIEFDRPKVEWKESARNCGFPV